MSLTDLKKSNKDNGKKKNFTVDEFIADAENYAQGKPKIVSSSQDTSQAVQEAVSAAKKEKSKKKRFRHATFTFNDKTFEQLNKLSKNSKLAKSHILRILIDQLSEEDKKGQLAILQGSEIE